MENQLYFADLYIKLAFCFVQSIDLLRCWFAPRFSLSAIAFIPKGRALMDEITRTVHVDIITEVVVVLTSPALY